MDEEARKRFRQRLGETLAWLNYTQPFQVGEDAVVRVSPLDLDEMARDPLWAADHPEEAVSRIVHSRAALLEAASVPVALPSVLPSGRVLLLLTRINLMDAAGVEPSGGFVDGGNVPMCDSWIDLFENVPMDALFVPGITRIQRPGQALACWVPGNLIERAHGAVLAMPEGCLAWADEFVPGFFDPERGVQE